jgi:acetyltransferase-like isoleucine patch superfamily enzyme
MSEIGLMVHYLYGKGKFEFTGPLLAENGPETIYIDNSGDITIGRGVSIGRGVCILTHEHFHDKYIPIQTAEADVYSLEIGDDVMLGMNAMILPQVRKIGKGAVIGAGSVLTKDVGEYEIWAGNPAKYIRTRE